MNNATRYFYVSLAVVSAFLAYVTWSTAPLISVWTDRTLSVAGALCFLFLARTQGEKK